MSVLLPAIVNGVVIGALFGLLGLSIVLVFRTTGVGNFAAGNMSMFASFIVFMVVVRRLGVGTRAGFLLGIVLGAVFGLLIYWVVIAPRSGWGHLNVTFRTLGLFALLFAVASRLWGDAEPYTVEGLFPRGTVNVLGLFVGYNQLGAAGVTAVMAAGLLGFFSLTDTGLIMRAVASDRDVAILIGIDVRRVELIAWTLAGALGAVGGMLIAPITLLGTDMMDLFLIEAFTAVILGGIYSFAGAIVGGLIVGVLYSVSGVYFNPEVQYVLSLFILVLMLLLRPAGIFGTARPVRV